MGDSNKLDQLKSAINDVLILGVSNETKVESIIHLFKIHQNSFNSGVIIGWLDVRVRTPDVNMYIDIKKPDGTLVFERLATELLIRDMKEKNAMWRPAIH